MKHDCPKDKAAIVNGQYVTGCMVCLRTSQNVSVFAAKYHRTQQQVNHRKDLLQRYEGGKPNPAWVREHEAQARQHFGDKETEEILRG